MPKKDKLQLILQSLREPYRSQSTSLYHKYYDAFRKAPCSKLYHGNYEGALYNHTLNVIEYSVELYRLLVHEDCGGIDEDMVKFTAFLHDFAKPIQQQLSGRMFRWHYDIILDLCNDEKIELEPIIADALRCHHGGWGPKDCKFKNELSLIIHFADMWSANIIETHR
jgi:hypothetical protein